MALIASSVAAVLALLALQLPAAAAAGAAADGCDRTCGDVGVPYPFGITGSAPGCYWRGFNLTCADDDTSGGKRLLLGDGSLQVGEISVENATVRVLHTGDIEIDHEGYGRAFDAGLKDRGPYTLSRGNELVVVGCNVYATLLEKNNDNIISGCASFCPNDMPDLQAGHAACDGMGCCRAPIVQTRDDVAGNVVFRWLGPTDGGRSDAGLPRRVFVAEEGWFDRNAAANLTSTAGAVVPVLLHWVVVDVEEDYHAPVAGELNCTDEAKRRVCKSSNSECKMRGRGYTCSCQMGYSGNPYVPDDQDGCKDIDECKLRPEQINCWEECANTKGSFECRCPKGTKGSPHDPKGCVRDVNTGLAIGLGVGSGVGIIVLILIVFYMVTSSAAASFWSFPRIVPAPETMMEAGDDDPAFVAQGSITGIRLTVASNEEIVKAQPMNEEFPLKHPNQLSGNPALGLPLQFGRCDSCGATDLAKCEGHFGFIKLPVSIYHPSHVDELTKILNMICFSCLQFKNCKVQKLMTKIPRETRRQLAVRGHIPQDGFVMSNLSVPPNCLRAFNVLDEELMCSPDASASLLRKVLRKVHEINSSRVGPPTSQEHEVEAEDLQAAIADYIKLSGTAQGPRDVTFGNQPAAKQWQQKMKSLFISKGSSFSCRAVITGDPYIPVNVIGLPDEVARRMSVQERVTDHNIAKLQGIMDKGLCLTYEDVNSNTYSLDVRKANKKRIILKVGETIDRRIIDGDIVFLNRPPSTDKHAVQALYVHIHTDHTIKINPLICGPLGADFDGDCVHIFFPRSVIARAEATELFIVENQLVSSHNGKLNFQLKNDCLLAIKKMSGRIYSRREAHNFINAMLAGGMTPKKRLSGGPKWSFNQILETLLPEEDKLLVRDLVAGTVTLSSILSMKNLREAIEFLNLLQPLLMESIHTDGFSISLRDFDVTNPIPKTIQNSSLDIDKFREQIVDFITHSSDLSWLVDPKSDSAVNKVVEQIGFLGHQLQRGGRLYSSSLMEDCLSKYERKCGNSTNGFIRSSFYNGLDPYEELLHSISAREKIIHASKGLVEPGSLFKNMMAMLRDVVACYDGTIRNLCGNSVVEFDAENLSSTVTPGDSVGILAATAVANAAYKAVLDPNQNNMTSWESMKEILLTRASSRTHENDQKMILYLSKCSCGKSFCMERASLAVQACLKRIKVEDCATEFSIQYQKHIMQATPCLVGHIHLDKKQLDKMNITMEDVLLKCQEAIYKQGKKKGQGNQVLKRIALISSECLCYKDGDVEKSFCLQFFVTESVTTEISESSERIVYLMVNTISPILLDTIIKGDSRVQEANIIWVEPQAACWIQNPDTEQKGELALEITMDIISTGESGDAWGTAMDACIPVMDLIDTTRSTIASIEALLTLCSFSLSFWSSFQHLSKSVGMVTKSVLKEHLTTVASSMTCTGKLHGFNSYGCKATFQSLRIQAPFMKATLSRPMECFQEGAEKVYSDQLNSVVSTCSWGNHAAIGTGSAFQIHWNDPNQRAGNGNLGGYGLYNFLAAVETARATEDNTIGPLGSCLYDVDNLQEDEVLFLGGRSPMSWTDKPKVDLLFPDLQGRRTERQQETRQINSNWSPAANWQHNKHTATGFAGKVYTRMQPKSNWNSSATQQDGNPGWNQANAAGPQNFDITGSSSSGGWNRKPGNLGQGGGRGAVWKSEGSYLGGSNSRSKTQRANTTGAQNFPISGPPNSAGWNMRTSNFGAGGGRGAAWKSSGLNRGGRNSRNRGGRNSYTGQRGSSNFTPEEQRIHAQVDPIQKEVKRIIRDSRDGIKLSENDEKFIVENILSYHPEKEKKVAGHDNYITVDKHKKYHSSRCLYVKSSDGSSQDFSYKKCLENWIRIHYPHAANSFCRKYFQG
ncbi:hypothetical protein ACQ4PT_061821 [Festuca glaucescens]